MTDIDVVVGCGTAGLTAALAAQEAGALVLIAETEGVVGGTTRVSARRRGSRRG